MEVLFKGSGIALTKNKPLNNLGVLVGSGTEALKTAMCADGDEFIFLTGDINFAFGYKMSRFLVTVNKAVSFTARSRESTPTNPVKS